MDIAKLSRIDLNLLVSLQVLMEERSVTRAADRLSITQPAMSKTLVRLRSLFDDPLFTRSGRGLVPTPRAVELQSQLDNLLGGLGELVARKDFDPANHHGVLQLGMPEFIAVQIIPSLIRRLETKAPNIILTVSSRLEDYSADMERGELDFVLEVEKKLPEDFLITPLGGFTPAIWMRRGHPLTKEELSLKNVLKYPFIQYFLLLSTAVSHTVDSRFDKTITRMGLNRRKSLVTDQLMTALDTIQSSNCLMLATMDDLKSEGEFYHIERLSYPPELKFDPFIPAVMVQHRRTSKSMMHSWFRQEILAVLREEYK